MPRRYFTLVVKGDGRWSPEFGDYDRDVVVAEVDDYRSQGYTAGRLKIIETADAQTAIDTAVRRLNGGA